MRIRFGVGLPGPFYLTSGRRRRRRHPTGHPMAWLFVVLLAYAGVLEAVRHWQVTVPVLAVIVALVLVSRHGARVKARQQATSAASQSPSWLQTGPAPKPPAWRSPS